VWCHSIRKILGAASIALLLNACATSGYVKFYKPAPGATPEAVLALRLGPPPATPNVERLPSTQEMRSLFDAYAKRGFASIGESRFNSGFDESDESAIEQGKKLGADLVVLLNPRHTGSTTTSMPLTLPTTTTSLTTSTATVLGAGGPVTAYGTGTTTTFGQQTTYVPVTINRTEYGAVFFVKRRWALGTVWRDLTDAERQELQSNKGVAVHVVVENSPAFLADILPGDIVLAVNGTPVLGQDAMAGTLKANAGQRVTLSLYRRGQRIDKDVRLN